MPFVLGDKFWVIPAIMLVITWKYFGFHMMIYHRRACSRSRAR